MPDLAELGVVVTSSGVTETAAGLNDLTRAAGGASHASATLAADMDRHRRMFEVSRHEVKGLGFEFANLAAELTGASGLRGAFAQTALGAFGLLNPLEMIVAGLGTAALAGAEFYRTYTEAGPSTEKLLKDQASLINEITHRWDSAATAVEGYGERSKGAMAATGGNKAGQLRDQMQTGLEDLYHPPFFSLRSSIAAGEAFTNPDTKVILRKLYDDMQAGRPDVIGTQNSLTDLANAHPEDNALVDKLHAALGPMEELQRSAEKTGLAVNALVGTGPAVGSFRGAQEGVGIERGRLRQDALDQQLAATTPQNEALSNYLDDIRLQNEELGKSALQQKIDSDLRRLNALDINAQTDGTAAYVEALDRQADAQKKAIADMDSLRSGAKDLFDTFLHGGNVLDALGSKLLNLGEDAVTTGAFGKRGETGDGIILNMGAKE